MSLDTATAGIKSLRSKMAPPRVATKKQDDSKDNSVVYDGDFFQVPPLPLCIVIIILLIFYWVSVAYCVFVGL